jgi:uncharacterized delta-60 repeat protein
MARRIAIAALLVTTWNAAWAGDANFDLGFGTLGVVNTTIQVPNAPALAIQADGKIIVTGRTPTIQPQVARLNGDGSFDSTFGTAGIATVPVTGLVFGVDVQGDGKILIAGALSATSQPLLARLDASGNLDPSFGTGGFATTSFPGTGSFGSLLLDPAGKVVALGTSLVGSDRFAIVGRYLLSDGSPDPTFGATGERSISVAPSTLGGGLARQTDGKLLIAGSIANSGPVLTLTGLLMRLDDAGSADGAFGNAGVATFDAAAGSDNFEDVALQPDGAILVTGTSGRRIVAARFTSVGLLDPTFAGIGYRHVPIGGLDSGRVLILQPDGKVVVVGYAFDGIGQPDTARWVVLRFLPDGSLDPGFGDGGRVQIRLASGIAYAAARQSDGKLVIAGLNGSVTTGPLAVVRLGGDCGDGAVVGLEACDDGNAIVGDCCDLACQIEPALQPCPNAGPCMAPQCDGAGQCGIVAPATGCKASLDPRLSSLLLKDAPGETNDRLVWKLRKGDETTPEDLGSPFTDTSYALCAYGPDLGSGPSLLFQLDAPAAPDCPGATCWSFLGRSGFGYKDKERTPSGLDVLRLRTGAPGRVTLGAKGKGANLVLPSLPLPLPARVQLRSSEGICWETQFSAAGVQRSDERQFKGRGN